MTDQEKAQAIERANSYRMMLESWAWKDLWKRVADERDSRLEKLMNQKGADDLEFTKGFVKAVTFINDEIGFVLGAAQ